MSSKLPPLEDLTLSEIPSYVSGYYACHATYTKNNASGTSIDTQIIEPEDAVFLRNINNKKDYHENPVCVSGVNPFLADKVDRLEKNGLVNVIKGKVFLTYKAERSLYTFIPR